MAYFRGLFGGAEAPQQTTDEVVEKFVERLETANAAVDKRNALKGLRSCAKSSRLMVATVGMNLYMDILNQDDDVEVIALTLDILNAVLSEEDEPTEVDELGDRLAEVLVKKPTFIPDVLKWLDHEHFTIRKNAVQLLTTLLRHRAREVQDAIVREPTGTSRVVELLHEQREIIRNHVVLMMSELSRGNTQLQQLLVFQNCFQLLFRIIEQESTDSIVVEDCLFVMLNLLKKNSKNQELFRENDLVKRLYKLTNDFLYPPEDADRTFESDWLPQKTANFIFILQVVRSLVSPVDNPHGNTHTAQRYVYQTGLIGLLCKTLLSEFLVSVDVLSETAVTVADVIRGNYSNQQYLAASNVSTNDGVSRSALMVLLLSMATEKQMFRLRCSVFYTFSCYLYGNDKGKLLLLDSLIKADAPIENNSKAEENIGQCLCRCIASTESIQVWFGCVLLAHALTDSDELKSQLLRVQITPYAGAQTQSLLNYVGSTLVSLGDRRLQTRCALLMLLGVWLNNSGPVVEEFARNDTYLDFLTSQLADTNTELRDGEAQVLKGLIAFVLGVCIQHFENSGSEQKNKLSDVINRRVGMDNVAEALDGMTKSEFYNRAAQRPLPSAANTQELLLDFQFCKLFKSMEGTLMKLFHPNGDFNSTPATSDVVVASYKKLIKQQDEHIADLKQQLDQLRLEPKPSQSGADADEPNGSMSPLAQKTAEITTLRSEIDDLKKQLHEREEKCVQFSGLSSNYDQLSTIVTQWQSEAERAKAWCAQWQAYQIAQLPDPTNTAVQQLQSQLTEMEQQLRHGWQCFEGQSSKLAQTTAALEAANLETQRLKGELDDARRQMTASSLKELLSARNDLEAIRREHEDTLILLAEQDTKLNEYKRRLRTHNEVVSDDEADDSIIAHVDAAPKSTPIPPISQEVQSQVQTQNHTVPSAQPLAQNPQPVPSTQVLAQNPQVVQNPPVQPPVSQQQPIRAQITENSQTLLNRQYPPASQYQQQNPVEYQQPLVDYPPQIQPTAGYQQAQYQQYPSVQPAHYPPAQHPQQQPQYQAAQQQPQQPQYSSVQQPQYPPTQQHQQYPAAQPQQQSASNQYPPAQPAGGIDIDV